ncbi:zincin-like metallopeptidase domain-containing protein [Tistrella mobilis]|uniref:zincin-like metallopeptidase domain-containing protein n=1 Tax=Tistrella mobilis TaxID=171437 RepID=UPI003556A372
MSIRRRARTQRPGRRFADQAYAREEPVAEPGAAFLCADPGVALTPREDHAAYLARWLDVLRADKPAIFQAARFAARAVDYLHAQQATASGAGQAVAQPYDGRKDSDGHGSAICLKISVRRAGVDRMNSGRLRPSWF